MSTRTTRLGGTEGNEILTSPTAVVLTLLLIAEGVTIVLIGDLLSAHMFTVVSMSGKSVRPSWRIWRESRAAAQVDVLREHADDGLVHGRAVPRKARNCDRSRLRRRLEA